MKKVINKLHQVQFNRELRTRSMVIRFHILWLAFYVALAIGIGFFVYHLYTEHKEDVLPAGYVDLKVGKQKYQPGDTVSFKVTNNFPTTIYITNNCPEEPLDVYKWDGSKWHQIHDYYNGHDGMCSDQSRRIAIKPNSTLSYSYKDWPDLFKKSGVYRIVMRVDHYEGVPYQDFTVLNKPRTIHKSSPQSSTGTQSQQQTQQTHNTATDDTSSSTTNKHNAEPEDIHENEVDDD